MLTWPRNHRIEKTKRTNKKPRGGVFAEVTKVAFLRRELGVVRSVKQRVPSLVFGKTPPENLARDFFAATADGKVSERR
jgi:hypothetical protein